MKILFFGTPRFAEIVLEKLFESQHKVVGVVARADKPAGRGNKMVSPKTVEMARQKGLAVFQPEKISEQLEDFRQLDCDIFVTASYGKILPKSLLDIHPCILHCCQSFAVQHQFRGHCLLGKAKLACPS